MIIPILGPSCNRKRNGRKEGHLVVLEDYCSRINTGMAPDIPKKRMHLEMVLKRS